MGCLEEPTQPSIVLLWSYYTSKDVLVRNSIFIDELDSLLLKPNQKIPKYLFYLPLLIAYHFPGKKSVRPGCKSASLQPWSR
jgi:hypothetical protein